MAQTLNQANYAKLGPAQAPQIDGLTACLNRIAAMVSKLPAMDDRFTMIADNITGGGLAGALAKQDTPEPTHIMFIAHAIESKLEQHMTTMSENAHRLETALS